MTEDRSVYRDWVKSQDLVKTVARHKETDLCIMADKGLKKEALEAICKYRGMIEEYIKLDPAFGYAMAPVEAKDGAFPIIVRMIKAGKAAGVGPMAAVAGAVAEFVGMDLLNCSREIIVENGGDIFIKSSKDRRFGIFAGGSPLTGRLSFEIIAANTPLGVCTSSGSVGHSLSFGKADAACIISKDTALADAVATKVGNIVKSAEDIERGIEFAKSVPGITGAIVVVGSRFGSWGDIKLGA